MGSVKLELTGKEADALYWWICDGYSPINHKDSDIRFKPGYLPEAEEGDLLSQLKQVSQKAGTVTLNREQADCLFLIVGLTGGHLEKFQNITSGMRERDVSLLWAKVLKVQGHFLEGSAS